MSWWRSTEELTASAETDVPGGAPALAPPASVPWPAPPAPAAPPAATAPLPSLDERPDVPDEHSADWRVRSRSLGGSVAPVISALVHEVPQVRAALVCSADGHNLCTVGVDATDVGRLSALTSTLVAAATAVQDAVTTSGTDADAMTVHVSAGDQHTALRAVDVPGHGRFVLGVHAEEMSLGTLLVQVRTTCEAVLRSLDTDLP